MHFVRPDGAYRTSVLQAIPGYQPVSNAQSVAARFTSAPYFATVMPQGTPSSPMAGFGAHTAYHYLPGFQGTPDFVTKAKMWWANMKAKFMAHKVPAMVAQMAQMQTTPDAPQTSYGTLPNAQANSPQVATNAGAPSAAMAQVALQITQGSTAVPQNDAAAQIAPDYAMNFTKITRMMENGVPGFVGRSAYDASINRWNGLRSMWWMNR